MKITIHQALLKAIIAHKSGEIQEAEKLYKAILRTQPNNADANHNMGVLVVGSGNSREALPFFKAALNCNSNVMQFWISYINTLISLELVDQAKISIFI